MQRLLFQPAKWMRRRINRISQPCFCLVFIASIGSYEGSEGLVVNEPICAERAVLTFNIVRNCLGSFEFMEGRWAGYGHPAVRG